MPLEFAVLHCTAFYCIARDMHSFVIRGKENLVHISSAQGQSNIYECLKASKGGI